MFAPRASFTLLILLLAAALSCRETTAVDSPVVEGARSGTLASGTSHDAAGSGAATGAVRARQGGALLACAHGTAATASATIGPAGGRIAVDGNVLLIPGGALEEEVVITATVPADDIAAVEFAPSGLRFRKPASMVLSAEGCEAPASAPAAAYLDDSGTIIERIDAVWHPRWKALVAPITHFSSYAIAL
jgi:hypothetical protein